MSNIVVCVDKLHCRVEWISWHSFIFIETDSGDIKSSTSKSVRHITENFFRSTFSINNTPNIYQNNMRAVTSKSR